MDDGDAKAVDELVALLDGLKDASTQCTSWAALQQASQAAARRWDERLPAVLAAARAQNAVAFAGERLIRGETGDAVLKVLPAEGRLRTNAATIAGRQRESKAAAQHADAQRVQLQKQKLATASRHLRPAGVAPGGRRVVEQVEEVEEVEEVTDSDDESVDPGPPPADDDPPPPPPEADDDPPPPPDSDDPPPPALDGNDDPPPPPDEEDALPPPPADDDDAPPPPVYTEGASSSPTVDGEAAQIPNGAAEPPPPPAPEDDDGSAPPPPPPADDDDEGPPPPPPE
jgi:hypothetical protein